MIKLLPLLLALLILNINAQSQTQLKLSLHDINGRSTQMGLDTTRKSLIVMLSSKEDSLSKALKIFAERHKEVSIYGVLSYDHGYSENQKSNLKAIYASSNIVVIDGQYAKKGAKQSELFQWLTDQKKNGRFNIDELAVGHTFLLTETGELLLVIPPNLLLADQIIESMISLKIPNGRNLRSTAQQK